MENKQVSELIGMLTVMRNVMIACAVELESVNKKHAEELIGAAQIAKTWIDGLREDVV